MFIRIDEPSMGVNPSCWNPFHWGKLTELLLARDRSDSICWACWKTEGKVRQVREEHRAGASGVPVVRQGIAGQLRANG